MTTTSSLGNPASRNRFSIARAAAVVLQDESVVLISISSRKMSRDKPRVSSSRVPASPVDATTRHTAASLYANFNTNLASVDYGKYRKSKRDGSLHPGAGVALSPASMRTQCTCSTPAFDLHRSGTSAENDWSTPLTSSFVPERFEVIFGMPVP